MLVYPKAKYFRGRPRGTYFAPYIRPFPVNPSLLYRILLFTAKRASMRTIFVQEIVVTNKATTTDLNTSRR